VRDKGTTLRTSTQRDREREALRVKRALQREYAPELAMLKASPGIFGDTLARVLSQAAYGGLVTGDNPAAGIPVARRAPEGSRKSELAWNDKGAYLDGAALREREKEARQLCPSPPVLNVITRDPDRVWVQTLWECQGERHARFCDCEAWSNGRPVAPGQFP
jgi:hypothetical protein